MIDIYDNRALSQKCEPCCIAYWIEIFDKTGNLTDYSAVQITVHPMLIGLNLFFFLKKKSPWIQLAYGNNKRMLTHEQQLWVEVARSAALQPVYYITQGKKHYA